MLHRKRSAIFIFVFLFCFPNTKAMSNEYFQYTAMEIDPVRVGKIMYMTNEEIFFVNHNSSHETNCGWISLNDLQYHNVGFKNYSDRLLNPRSLIPCNMYENMRPESVLFLNKEKTVLSLARYGTPFLYDKLLLEDKSQTNVTIETLFSRSDKNKIHDVKIDSNKDSLFVTGYIYRESYYTSRVKQYFSLVLDKDFNIIKEITHPESFGGFRFNILNDEGYMLSTYCMQAKDNYTPKDIPLVVYDINEESYREISYLPLKNDHCDDIEKTHLVSFDNNQKLTWFYCDKKDDGCMNTYFHMCGLWSAGKKQPVYPYAAVRVCKANNNKYIAQELTRNQYVLISENKLYLISKFLELRCGDYISKIVGFNDNDDILLEIKNKFPFMNQRIVLLKSEKLSHEQLSLVATTTCKRCEIGS